MTEAMTKELAQRRLETLLKVQMDELPAEGSRDHITKHDHMTDKEAPRGELTQQGVTEGVRSLRGGKVKF